MNDMTSVMLKALALLGNLKKHQPYKLRASMQRGWRPWNKLNRSLNWAPADSYREARALAPDPYQPIR